MTNILFDKSKNEFIINMIKKSKAFKSNQIISFQITNQLTYSKIHLEQLSTNRVKNRITSDELGHKYSSKVHVTIPETDIAHTELITTCGVSRAAMHNTSGILAQPINTNQVAQVFSYTCLDMTFKYNIKDEIKYCCFTR
jgi:homoaconitase/3-isopropylmalate dehydratase large subunit